jgi:hypothetical protein
VTAPAFNPVPVDAPADDPVAALHASIDAWVRGQDEVATRMLTQRDATLDPLRTRVRPALQPIMVAFDAQRANAHKAAAPDGTATLTPRGLDERLAEIERNRAGAVEAVVAPAREALADAARQTRAQLATVGDTATEADAEAAAQVAHCVAILTPANQVPLLARWLRDAAAAGDVGRVAALVPYLRSLEETTGGAPDVAALVSLANRATATWQHTVASARLARIERMQWELGELTTAALQGGPNGDLLMRLRGFELLADDDGDGAAAPPAPAPPADEPRRPPVRRVALAPAARAAARDAVKRRPRDDDDE